MGYLSASEMVETMGSTDIDTALIWHLTSNHYPPVPTTMVEPCKQAITAFVEHDRDRAIPLPDGVFWRGQNVAPAWAIVEGHHLEAFIDAAFGEEDV